MYERVCAYECVCVWRRGGVGAASYGHFNILKLFVVVVVMDVGVYDVCVCAFRLCRLD